jgi:hypothetical protein
MLRIDANYSHNAFAFDNLAFIAHLFHTSSNFHCYTQNLARN